MKPIVSIPVAVYNAEKYLRKCLDSLLAQTYRDIEILCVDDCSTDSSRDILKEYAAKDERIKVFYLSQNQGQAKARNYAIEHSVGEIVMFLDSDDWFAEDSLEIMMECFEKNPQTDCVLFDVQYVYPDGKMHGYRTPPFEVMDGREAFVKSLDWTVHGWYATRSEMYRKYPYDDTCRHYSDDNTTRIHFYHSREIRCCTAKYFYRQNSQSVTNIISTSRLDYIRANESMKRQLLALNVSEDIISFYENQRWLILLWTIILYVRNRKAFNKEERQLFKSEIKRVWKTIEYDRIYPKNKYKPGYYPFGFCWPLFRIEYELFSFFRILLNRV